MKTNIDLCGWQDWGGVFGRVAPADATAPAIEEDETRSISNSATGSGMAAATAAAQAAAVAATAALTAGIKEHFLVTAPDGSLYHYTVEGSLVRHGLRIPADPAVHGALRMAWKGDHVLTGDNSGNLALWDLRTKTCKPVTTPHTSVRAMAWAPGRGVLRALVLYTDGVDVWDFLRLEVLATIRDAKGTVKEPAATVAAIAWAAADRPVLVTADGSIRICDLGLITMTSPIRARTFEEPVLAPYAADPKAALAARATMQFQPMNGLVGGASFLNFRLIRRHFFLRCPLQPCLSSRILHLLLIWQVLHWIRQ